MANIKRKIITNIYEDLRQDISDSVFYYNDFESLGEYYFNKVLENVPGSVENDLLSVLDFMAEKQGKRLENRRNYYNFLCKTINLIRVPKDVLSKVNLEYHNCFEVKYGEVKTKYENAIAEITSQEERILLLINDIGNRRRKITVDISSDIEQLRDYYREQNKLRTKKAILTENLEYLEEELYKYCNLDDANDISETNRRLAFECSLILSNDDQVEQRFFVYKQFIGACECVVDNYDLLFFNIKMMPFIGKAYKAVLSPSRSQEEREEEYGCIISRLYSERDILCRAKSIDSEKYNEKLKTFIMEHSIVEEITEYVSSLICLEKRRNILGQILELYNQKNYLLLLNIIPIQIEGIFSDLQDDMKSFERFSHCCISPSADLKVKIEQIHDNIPFEFVQYFKHYFNNLIRNIVAHGRATGDDTEINDEILVNELLLDFHSLLYMVSRNSEAEKMYIFVNRYIENIYRISSSSDSCYKVLFNDLIGDRTILTYDSVEHYPPLKIVLWILNPYYEELYDKKAEDGDTSLIELRELLFSKEFWEYAKKETAKYTEWHWKEDKLRNLSTIINGLLSCGVSEETKALMIEIHKILNP